LALSAKNRQFENLQLLIRPLAIAEKVFDRDRAVF